MNEPRILLVEDEDIVAGFIEHTLAGSRLDVIRTLIALGFVEAVRFK